MNRLQLHALLRKAQELSGHSEFVIVGSLAILGAVADPPNAMVMSIDVDTYMKADPGRTGELCDALGQGSPFEYEHGYYLDPVSPNLPSFPEGWQDRLIQCNQFKIWVVGVRAYTTHQLERSASCARSHRRLMRLENRHIRRTPNRMGSGLLIRRRESAQWVRVPPDGPPHGVQALR